MIQLHSVRLYYLIDRMEKLYKRKELKTSYLFIDYIPCNVARSQKI